MMSDMRELLSLDDLTDLWQQNSTFAHELLHAAGLLDHDGRHSEIVKKVAPAPKLRDSPVLRRLRQKVLEELPEGQWICGKCGHAWERRRVTRPVRCPKCASRFESK